MEEVQTPDSVDEYGIAALKQILMNEKLAHTDTQIQLEITRRKLAATREQLASASGSEVGAPLAAVDEATIDD